MSLIASLVHKIFLLHLNTNTFITLLWFTLVFFALRMIQMYLQMKKLPPGPWGVPLLGFLPYLSPTPHLQFTQLSKKYGKTFSTRLGSRLVVILSDYKVMRQAFRKEAFSGRPANQISSIIEGYGLINADGNLWKEQRRFLHEILRSFGMKHIGSGKEQLEARIMVEVDEFLWSLGKSQNKPIMLNCPLTLAITNVICSILMSVRFKEDDKRFLRFMKLIEEGFRLCAATGATNFIPCLKNIPRLQAINDQIKQNRMEMCEFFKEIVDTHKNEFDPNNIRDVVDTYIYEIRAAEKEGRFNELFGGKDPDRQIYQILGDMYSAGMETVQTAIRWAFLFMLHHPEVMEEVQQELDEVVGDQRLPSANDLPFLPYTEATILEVLRRASIVPLGTTHSATKDVYLSGHLIPKDSQVIPLIYSIHMDEKLWDEPKKFNPSRFINEAGAVEKPEYFMPFGVGRRMCLGEVLARHEIFLFFSSLLHVFKIQPANVSKLPDLIGKTFVTITPEDHEVVLTARKPHLLSRNEPANKVRKSNYAMG